MRLTTFRVLSSLTILLLLAALTGVIYLTAVSYTHLTLPTSDLV